MTYTIVDVNDSRVVRAVLNERKDYEELITKLQDIMNKEHPDERRDPSPAVSAGSVSGTFLPDAGFNGSAKKS